MKDETPVVNNNTVYFHSLVYLTRVLGCWFLFNHKLPLAALSFFVAESVLLGARYNRTFGYFAIALSVLVFIMHK
jgi:hypothetical protein